MTDGFHVSWSRTRPERTPAEAAELSLVRMGRFVILASFLAVMGENTLMGFPLFSVLMLLLYVGYVAVYWIAIRTRRVEAATLGVIAVSLAVLYVGAAIPLWGRGP